MADLRRRAAKPRVNARLLAISCCTLLLVAATASAGSNELCSFATRIESNPIIVASAGMIAAARALSREANSSFENS